MSVVTGLTLGPRVQDYTMAQYRPETFEVLAYNLTVKQLVEKLGYPRVRPQL